MQTIKQVVTEPQGEKYDGRFRHLEQEVLRDPGSLNPSGSEGSGCDSACIKVQGTGEWPQEGLLLS